MSARSIVVALAALFALAPAAHATTETATSGTVTATLSYDHVQDSFEYTNMALTISRAGVQVLSPPIRRSGTATARTARRAGSVGATRWRSGISMATASPK